jgi:hypothetical protein
VKSPDPTSSCDLNYLPIIQAKEEDTWLGGPNPPQLPVPLCVSIMKRTPRGESPAPGCAEILNPESMMHGTKSGCYCLLLILNACGNLNQLPYSRFTLLLTLDAIPTN